MLELWCLQPTPLICVPSSTTKVFLKTVTRQSAWAEMEEASHKVPQPAVNWHMLGDQRADKQTPETSGWKTKITNLSCKKHFNSVAPSGRWCVFHCERIISIVDDVEIYVFFLIADHTSITLNSNTDIT